METSEVLASAQDRLVSEMVAPLSGAIKHAVVHPARPAPP